MSIEIDLDKGSFTELEKNYILQRPWLGNEELRAKLAEGEVEEEDPWAEYSDRELRIELKRRDQDYSEAPREELLARLEEE